MARKAQGTTVDVDVLLPSKSETPTYSDQLSCPMTISGIGGGDRAEIDTTTLCSTAKEFMLGLKDEGTIQMEMPWDPVDAGQAIVQTAADATGDANRLAWQITFPADGGDPAVVATFEGLVKKFEKSAGVDDILKANLEVRVVTAITLA